MNIIPHRSHLTLDVQLVVQDPIYEIRNVSNLIYRVVMFAAQVPCRLYTCRRLKELGGKAKTKEISSLSRIKYPDATLYEFVDVN